jgi:hypothetical protein
VASAQGFSFYHRGINKSASDAEIAAAWEKVHSGSAAQKRVPSKDKKTAGHYENESDLRISDDSMDIGLDEHIRGCFDNLRKIYMDFDDFPSAAKFALVDMIYNIGAGRAVAVGHSAHGLRSWVHLNAAIQDRDWFLASSLCHRARIEEARNTWTKGQFWIASVEVGQPGGSRSWG